MRKTKEWQSVNQERYYPIGSCVVNFGRLPIRIMVPPGTLNEQRKVLRERIKAHANSLYESKIWEEPIREDELNEVMSEAKIKH